MDDMLLKSLQSDDHIRHLEQTFQILGKYRMQINPTKCVFGGTSKIILGFMVYHQGIEANLEKIQTLLDMKSLEKVKEIQCLTGCITF